MAELNDFDYSTDATYDEWRTQIETTLAWLAKAQAEQAEAHSDLVQAVSRLRTWFGKTLGRLGIETPVDYGGNLRILS